MTGNGSTQLVPFERPAAPPITLDEARRLGETLAASGYFQDAREVAQAAVKVLAGAELGGGGIIGPIAAMTGIHIVKNRVMVGSHIIATLIRNHPRYEYQVPEHTDEACTIEILDRGKVAGTSRFTIADAERAGLANRENWKANPKNMVFARAISNAAKWYCPDVLGGPVVYTPEELDADPTPEPTQPEVPAGVDPQTGEIVDTPDEGDDNRPLKPDEADRLLVVLREPPRLTAEDMRAALAAIGLTEVGDLEPAIRHLTVSQALALIEETTRVKALTGDQSDLPWNQEAAAAETAS